MADQTNEEVTSAPLRPIDRPVSTDGRFCRICHLSDPVSPLVISIADAKTSKQSSQRPSIKLKDEFLTPCKCAGTVKYVHRSCLNAWRLAATGSDSYFRCDLCLQPYRFRGSNAASILGSRGFLKILTLLVFGGWTILCAYVACNMDALFMKLVPLDGTLYYDEILIEPTPLYYLNMPNTGKMPGTSVSAFKQPAETNTLSDGSQPDQKRLPPPHSKISYFNISFWITGHSSDDAMDEFNDFFLTIHDLLSSPQWDGLLAGATFTTFLEFMLFDPSFPFAASLMMAFYLGRTANSWIPTAVQAILAVYGMILALRNLFFFLRRRIDWAIKTLLLDVENIEANS